MVSLLKNKFVLLFSFFCLAGLGLLPQCSSDGDKSNKQETVTGNASCSPDKINPNGSSELSVLMRTMLKSSVSLKEMIKQGKLPDKFPEEFLKIHTATPTDAATKKASFDGFATAYLVNMKTLFNSPKEELTQNYNSVVNACIACHSEHCPGPLAAIKKLTITQ